MFKWAHIPAMVAIVSLEIDDLPMVFPKILGRSDLKTGKMEELINWMTSKYGKHIQIYPVIGELAISG